ncbi:MAG: hypothetical protein QM831_05955 [Kofleriaceae bacterium]
MSGHGPVVAYNELGQEGLSHDDPVTAYRRANVYPPSSRPLTLEHDDLLHPNKRHESLRPTEADDGVEFLFTADKYFVVGDDVLNTRLTIMKGGSPVVGAKIVQAFAAIADPNQPNPAQIPMQYTAGEGGFNAVLTPSTIGVKRQAAIGVYVEFDDGTGHGTQRGHFDFQYDPSGAIPARFNGTFSDAIVNGSLVVYAGIDVKLAGNYIIDCNLYDNAGSPVGWTRWKQPLAQGSQKVDLTYFGKVIVDAKASGPFHIGELRGARFVPGSDPDLEQMADFTGTYATAPYKTNQFSDAEYDSAQKQQMLQMLSDQAAKGVHQGAATETPASHPGDEH